MNTVDVIAKRFGVKTTTRENPLVVELGVAALRLLPLSPRRLAFIIVNLGANIAYIAPSGDVAATHGIMLAAAGGSYTGVFDEDFELVTKEWYGIAAGANNAVYALEVLTVSQ